MNISKAGFASSAAAGGRPDETEMALIRSYARGDLKAEEVYTFPVILCDNEIDRDFERFDEKTLGDLAALFLGRTGISDHDWRSENQVARIYRTELERDPVRKTSDGLTYVSLRAWAYMLRSEANAPLIADIEGGIRKEVSVGCSIAKSFCSVCGAPAGGCSHVRGQTYDGQLCYHTLTGGVDAYEWSFVAVPAQRGAGVTKQLSVPTADPETEALAELGRRYLAETRTEVKRLALLCGKDFHAAVAPALDAMTPEALLEMRTALRKRASKLLPVHSQFPEGEKALRFDGTAYRV